MEQKQEVQKEETKKVFYKSWKFWGVIVLLIIILAPAIKDIMEINHEMKLSEEGKIVSAREITNRFKDALKDMNYSEVNYLLSEDCKMYYNSEQQYRLTSFLENLENYEDYMIEKRGNSIDDEETYRIYWNGLNYSNSSQIIDLYMRKKVKKDEITYEIYMIRLTDNSI